MAKKKKTTKSTKKRTTKKVVKKTSTRKVAKKTVKKTKVRTSVRKSAKKTTKKPTKKKAVKKSVKKASKKISRRKTSKELIIAVGDQCFWIYEGPIIKDLNELARAFGDMQDYQFEHHTQESNDFANWVEGVLDDKLCANSLRKARTISESLFVLDRVLKRYL